MDPYLRRQLIPASALTVSDFNYAEVVKRNTYPLRPDSVMSYDVNFNFKVARRTNSTLTSYDRVRVTVKKKKVLGSIPSIGPTSLNQTPQIPNFSLPLLPEIVNSTNLNAALGLNMPSLPPQVERRVYSGLQIVSDSSRVEQVVITKDVSVLSLTSPGNNTYKVTDIRKVSSGNVASYRPIPTTLPIKSLLSEVNKDKEDPTSVVTDKSLSVDRLSSPSDDLSIDVLASLGKNLNGATLREKLLKYYVTDVERTPNESGLDKYEKTETVKSLDYVDFSASLEIPFSLKTSLLEVKYELYSLGSAIPSETIIKDFNFSKQVDIFETIQTPPSVYIDSLTQQNTINLVVVDNETIGKVSSYAVYIKRIMDDGTVDNYSFVDTYTKRSNTTSIVFPSTGTLTCVRVVPVDILGNESNVFTNVIVGQSYPSMGNMVILTDYDKDNPEIITVRIEKIPTSSNPATIHLKVTQISDRTERHYSNNVGPGDTRLTFRIVTSDLSGNVDFFAYITPIPSGLPYGFSNSVGMLVRRKATTVGLNRNNINVTTSDLVTDPVNYDTSFLIKTTVNETENNRIKNFISQNLPDLYAELVDPRTPSNPSNGFGQTIYERLYAHEVARTNLDTGERETFSIVSDGVFKDNDASRTVSGGIKPINPSNEYVYQVFTYVKDPLTLMREYVLKVTPSDNKSYYYHPFKWRNFQQRGAMPPTDGDDLPLIGQYENLTTYPLGCVAEEIRLYGNRDFISVKDVIVERIDRNTNKVSWGFDTSNYTEKYDSFVVLKVVNGIRKILGRTRLNYIYHELSSDDLGTVYYTIVPVTTEFDIDDAAHSSPVLISPDELVTPIPISPLSI